VTSRYLLDTDMCIYLMTRQPPQVAARFAELRVGDVVMSAVTLAELVYGVTASGPHEAQNREALDLLTEHILPLPFDAPAAAAYGPIRLATRERTRDALDKLIAAHAVAVDAILVTNNTADFAVYPGLRVENWVE